MQAGLQGLPTSAMTNYYLFIYLFIIPWYLAGRLQASRQRIGYYYLFIYLFIPEMLSVARGEEYGGEQTAGLKRPAGE